MDYYIELKRILSELRSDLKTVRNELRNYPKGRLMLSNNHGNIQKILTLKEKDGKISRRGIGKDVVLVHKLARKEFLKNKLICLKNNISLLEKTLNGYKGMEINDILPALPRYYDRLPPEILQKTALLRARSSSPHPDKSVPLQPARTHIGDQDPKLWGSEPYRPNTSFQENKLIHLSNGLTVRSKSEAAIAELYEKHDVPYHYDEVLSFANLFFSSDTGHRIPGPSLNMFRNEAVEGCLPETTPLIYSPDFIAARKDGALIFHEHLGMIKDQDYMSATQQKLKIYAACGIVPWKNLVITYDTADGGIDLRLVECNLRTKYLF